MMSAVGLELSSFINPDLTWKTVPKGNRSRTRRTRKQGARSLTVGMGLANKNARTEEDVTVSESEKLGVDVLGRRFSENVENVPIKKRRPIFRSPSPPSPMIPLPHLETPVQHVDFQQALGQNSGSSSVQRQRVMKSNSFVKSTVASICYQKFSDVINDEDFSGIEILAAAACSDSISNIITENTGNSSVEELTQDRIESSASALRLEETTASLETVCCSSKDSSKTEGSSLQDNSFSVLHESPSNKDNTAAELSIPLPDDRLLWDLNLSMDAWPCDGGIVDSQKDTVDTISVRSEELQTREPQDSKNDSMKKVISTDVDGGNKMTSELRAMPVETDDLSREKLGFTGCSGLGESKTEHVPVPKVETESSLMSKAIDLNASVETVNMDLCLGRSPFPGSDLRAMPVDGHNKMTSDLSAMPVETVDLSREKHGFTGCFGLGENKIEHVPEPMVEAEGSLMSTAVDIDASVETVNMDQCLSRSPFPGSDKSTWVSEVDRETCVSTLNIELKPVRCISEAEVGKIVCVESVQVEESDVASPCLPVLEMADNEILNTSADKGDIDHDGDSGLHDVEVLVENVQVEESDASPCLPVLETVDNEIPKTSADEGDKDHDGDSGLHDVEVFVCDPDNPQPLESAEVDYANGAEEMDICHFSPKSQDMSISDDHFMEAVGLTDGASSAYTAQVDTDAHVGSDVLLQKSSRNSDATSGAGEFSTHEACRIYVNGPTTYLGKANLNDTTPKESRESAISQDKELTVGMGNHWEVQAGYDSQFEDGELRESDAQCLEEAELVDYDTEVEERSFGLEAEIGEQKLKVGRGSSLDAIENFKYCETGEALRENSVSLKMRNVELPDGETKKIDCLNGSNIGNYDIVGDISKLSKRELPSHVEGLLSSDAVQRSRCGNFDGSYPRAERETGSDKFFRRDRSTSYMHRRSPGGGHFFNPSANRWDSKRQHAPIYHGRYNFGHPRPKGGVETHAYPLATDQAPSEAAGVARPDNRFSRQFMGSSNGVYQPLLRSPVERDDSYNMHPRMPTVRDTSPDRISFTTYPQGVSRGIRDEYVRHVPDGSTEYASRITHRIGKREKSISPHGGRPHYTVPYKRTRPRSRSRSPLGWLKVKNRNEGSRRRSRSPDFRSDARMDRVRLPFIKRFAADYGEEFISPLRSRNSPERKFRMFEDRNPGLDHFRGRKSPVGMFRQGQRFDQVRPIQRLNSDDYFRPMIRPRRFPDMAAGGRRCKYDGSDDDKRGNRYEMTNRVRRYDI